LSMGKKSVVVGDGDHSALRRLLDGADIVVTTGNGSGPGGDERWPVREVLAADERLIHVSITPFGATGPRRDWRGSNLIAFASSGILTTVGFPGEAPLVPGGPAQLACHLAALNAAAGALLALQSRRRTGRGQLVDISLQEACLWLSPETGMPVFLDDGVHRTRPGNRREVVRPWGLYPAKDGYVSFLIIQPAHWDAMARWIADVTGNDVLLEEVFRDLSVRMQSMELCDEHTEELTRRFTKRELFLEGQRRSIPITPVNTMADLRDDPHLLAARFWLDVEHPKLGTVSMPGPPFRPQPWSMAVQRAPLLGEHTATYLA
jgi:crotonobetainyl-CoA:carnitine CoA-transferase CaiB-like acyl-CoA transferase